MIPAVRADRPAVLLVLPMLSLVLAACGGGQARGRTPDEVRRLDPASLLDPASHAVVRLDFARLRASAHAETLAGLFAELRGRVDLAGLEAVVDGTAWALAGLAEGPEGRAQPTIVLVDTLGPAALAAALERGLGPGLLEVQETPAPWRASAPRWVVVHDGEGLAAVTTREGAEALLARWAAPSPRGPFARSPGLARAAELVAYEAGFLGAAVDLEALPARLQRELAEDPGLRRWTNGLEVVGAAADLADGLEVRVAGVLPNELAARALASEIQEELDRAQRNLLLDLLLGVRPLLSATHALADGEVARVTTRLPAGETERLLASLRGVLGYADRAVDVLREESRRPAPGPTGPRAPGEEAVEAPIAP